MSDKYLFVAHEGNYSGANRAALEFTDVLRNSGKEIDWLVPAMGEFSKILQSRDYEVHIIGFYNWTGSINESVSFVQVIKKSLRNCKSIWSLKKLIRKEGYNRVVSNSIAFYVAAVAAYFNRAVKHLWVIHEFGEEDHGIRPWVGNKGYVWMGRLSDRVIINSEAVAKKFRKYIPSDKIVIQPNYLQLDESPKDPDSFSKKGLQLIMLGQIASGKGHWDAIKAMEEIVLTNPEIRLHIYGHVVDETYYSNLKGYTKERKLSENIEFKGISTQPLRDIRSHDIFLMCSHQEAFGRVTVEALSVGVPVIAFKGGASVELISENEFGFFYSDYKELVQKIKYVASNIDLLPGLSKKAINIRKYNESSGEKVIQSFTV